MNNQLMQNESPEKDRTSIGGDRPTQIFGEWFRRVGYYSIFAAVGTLVTGSTTEIAAQETADNFLTLPREMGSMRKRGSFKPQTSGPVDQRLQIAPPTFPFSNITGTDDCPGTAIPPGTYTAAAPYTDTGDTTGANNTVNNVVPYYSYNANGPDKIYSFVVTSIGPNPEIKVTATSPGYHPMIYVSDHPCPAGTGGTLSDWAPGRRWYSTKVSWAEGSNTTATIGDWAWDYWEALYFGRRMYLYIDSPTAGEAGAYTLTIKDMQVSSTPKVERHGRPDFDGDGLSDFAVFRPSNSTWYIKGSTQGASAVQWGLPTDTLVPEDYDGDGKTDVAIYRDGAWHILGSTQGYMSAQWGLPGDIPVPADYTGDGVSEVAIFRNGSWWMYNLSTGGAYNVNWGLAGDKPVPMDYDADGKVDPAVVRNGAWYLYRSRLGTAVQNWGLGSDKIVPFYFGPHNQADFSVYRNGTWFTLIPPFYWDVPGGLLTMQWGLPTDTPVAGNFFNTYSADAGVFRDGNWWMRECAGDKQCPGRYVVQWGQAGDIPISGVYNR